MVIYCDRLTVNSCVRLVRLSWRNLVSHREIPNIQVLDSLPKNGFSKLLRNAMQRIGFCVEEADFFTGHLRTKNGEVIWLAARSEAIDHAFKMARRILSHSNYLDNLNRAWGRNTILNYIAMYFQDAIFQLLLRFKIVEALRNLAGDPKAQILVQWRCAFDVDFVREAFPYLNVDFYRSWLFKSLIQRRASVFLLLVYGNALKIKWFFENLILQKAKANKYFNDLKTNLPTLLLLQEDDLSFDRSYRTQPHWLFEEDGKPPFRTIIIHTDKQDHLNKNRQVMKEQDIISMSWKELSFLSSQLSSSRSVLRGLNKDIWECAFRSLLCSFTEIEVMFRVARLLYTACILVPFCERNNIKAFMTCENYMLYSDAMQLIAKDLGITTMSYQYSNMAKASSYLMTSADMMFTFSSLYHQRWSHNGVKPGKFVNIGYIYDTSFKYMDLRVKDRKRRLLDSGAKFIICYFDESVQHDKYGCVSVKDHCLELLALIGLVLNNPSIGVIVKTQFQRNSPKNFKEIVNELGAAKATGRFVELEAGVDRNTIFPSEAALSADMAIGHAVGATAPLEAALAGVRCIILNPCGIKDGNINIYKRANIMFSSMSSALEAIQCFRKGENSYRDLGDWSPIIDKFDSFRDGQAGHRLRNILEQIVMCDEK